MCSVFIYLAVVYVCVSAYYNTWNNVPCIHTYLPRLCVCVHVCVSVAVCVCVCVCVTRICVYVLCLFVWLLYMSVCVHNTIHASPPFLSVCVCVCVCVCGGGGEIYRYSMLQLYYKAYSI